MRSYKSYENDPSKKSTIKYQYLFETLEKFNPIDEEHGILTIDDIKTACKMVLDEYSVKYCVLFGSYAKGKATELSDVDLLISSDVTGLRFFGIVERLREEFHIANLFTKDFNDILNDKEVDIVVETMGGVTTRVIEKNKRIIRTSKDNARMRFT